MEDSSTRPAGRFVQISGGASAFVPDPLPPQLAPTWEFVSLLGEADRSLSQLAGTARTLPNPHLLIAPFTRREAVLSSRIEGTLASLSDLFSYEASGIIHPERADVREVSNYVAALEHGIRRLQVLPLSLRLIRELHERIMQEVRGQDQRPGEFRTRQNWIGAPGANIDQARYVPPPAGEIAAALDSLEKYLHAATNLPPLVRTAFVHYQFEAIHPFLDGNGRVGRLLITLMLIAEKLLPQPLLYLSAFFERHRSEYYDSLLRVSQRGEWGNWVQFFLRGVISQSVDALQRANRLRTLSEQYRDQLQRDRSSGLLLRLADYLFTTPAVTTKMVATVLNITQAAAQKNIDKLQKNGVLKEITRRQRGRIYLASEIVRIAEEPGPEQLDLAL